MKTIEKQLKIKLIWLINLLNANNLAKIKLYSHEIKNENLWYITINWIMLWFRTPLEFLRSKEILMSVAIQTTFKKKFILELKNEKWYSSLAWIKKIY